jgi:hypothetical protein
MKIALLASLALAAAGQTFPISGTVVDAGSGAPMQRVRVTLAPYGRTADQRATVTAGDGKFSFEVPKGKFVLTAEYRGIRQPFGQRGPGIGFNVAVFTGPDQDTSHLTFQWFARGAITGKVIDDRGEPVQDALVQLIRTSVVLGRRTHATAAWSRTNDLGEYRFFQWQGGTYYLAVTGEPWYTARSQPVNLPGRQIEPGEPARSYAPVYYPNASDPGGAQPLELVAGAEVTADFRLSTVTGVNVHIHCPHAPGQSALITLLTEGLQGVDTHQRQAWLIGNDQTIAGVLPGHYIVSIDGRNGDTSSARKAIDVGQSDVSVDLTMAPAASVSGKVIFKDPDHRPRRPAYIRLVAESNGAAIARQVDASGVFSFDNVRLGRQRVQMTGADGFFASQITAEGAEVDGPFVDIVAGATVQLNIAASDEIGTLKGFVMDGGKPVAGVLAVLAPKNDSKDPGDYRGFQTDSDGSFDYQNVRAGDYVLFAVERVDLEYASPAAVRPYLTSGKPVRIPAHAAIIENASLIASIPQK